MASPDYMNVSLPIGLIKKIDEFLDSEYAKNEGINSRAELCKILLRKFFEDFDAKKREKRFSH